MITKTKHINAGSLDKRVTFRYYTTSSDGMGGLSPDSPTNVITTWANVEPVSGQELFGQGAANSNITHRITVRHREDLSSQGYTRDTYDHLLEAVYDGRIFNIQHAINGGEDDRFVTLMAVEEELDET